MTDPASYDEMRLISTVNSAFRKSSGSTGTSAGSAGGAPFGSFTGSATTKEKTIVSTGEWKSKCESILVPASDCRPPRSVALTGRLSRSFPLRIGSATAQKRAKPDGSDGDRRLQWAREVDEAYAARRAALQAGGHIQASTQAFSPYLNRRIRKAGAPHGAPRRLTLHEKVDLYTDRPDLDLAGIMPRLEAIRRMERMSSVSSLSVARTGSFASEDDSSGSSSGSDDDDDDNAEESGDGASKTGGANAHGHRGDHDHDDQTSRREEETKLNEEKNGHDDEEKKTEEPEEKLSDEEDVAMQEQDESPADGAFPRPSGHSAAHNEQKLDDIHPMVDSDEEDTSPKVGIDSDDEDGDDEDCDKTMAEFGQDRYEEQRASSGPPGAATGGRYPLTRSLSAPSSAAQIPKSVPASALTTSLAFKKQRLQKPVRSDLVSAPSRFRLHASTSRVSMGAAASGKLA